MGLMDIFNISKIKAENERLKVEVENLNKQITTLGITEYYQAKQKISLMEKDSESKLAITNKKILENNIIIDKLHNEISELQEKSSKLSKTFISQERKLARSKELYKSIDYAINNFFESDIPYTNCKLKQKDIEDVELLTPTVTLKLHCMDIKSLRQAYRDNEKQIHEL